MPPWSPESSIFGNMRIRAYATAKKSAASKKVQAPAEKTTKTTSKSSTKRVPAAVADKADKSEPKLSKSKSGIEVSVSKSKLKGEQEEKRPQTRSKATAVKSVAATPAKPSKPTTKISSAKKSVTASPKAAKPVKEEKPAIKSVPAAKPALKRTKSAPELSTPESEEPVKKAGRPKKVAPSPETPPPLAKRRGRPKTVAAEPVPEISSPKKVSSKSISKTTATAKKSAKPTKKTTAPSASLDSSDLLQDILSDIEAKPIKAKKTTATSVQAKGRKRASSLPVTSQSPATSTVPLEVPPQKVAKRTSKKSAEAVTPSDSDKKESLLSPTAAAVLKDLPTGEDDFVINDALVSMLSADMKRSAQAVRNTLVLLKEGNTVPFITRYRKEMIGEMDETHVRNIHKVALQYTALQQRKVTVLETIKQKHPNQLTPELEQAILETTTMRHLEDLYAPYKPKKNSLADVAISKGLLSAAETLLSSLHTNEQLSQLLQPLLDPAKDLNSLDDILLGIQHIWAEKISDAVFVRDAVRPLYAEFGTISVTENTSHEATSSQNPQQRDLPSRKKSDTYAHYFDFSRPISALRSHNVMAINRGEREKFLKVKYTVPEPEVLTTIATTWVKNFPSLDALASAAVVEFSTANSEDASSAASQAISTSASQLIGNKLAEMVGPLRGISSTNLDDDEIAPSTGRRSTTFNCEINAPIAKEQGMHYSLLRNSITDAFKRLLHPSLVKESRNAVTESAESDSIDIFSQNLKSLLLKPPVNNHVIMGIDPGFTHGCKTCTIDESGKVLETRVIFPLVGESRIMDKLREFDVMVRKHHVSLIAVGNGTAHKPTIEFVKRYRQVANSDIEWCLVDESGASVYSVSPEAQAEFPDLDPAGRGAASIARRTLDPMAEIVKIPTQSIGVGSYQHDVNQKELERSLSSVVEDCVNYVGVNLNTASQPLLRRISGLNPSQASSIVKHRNLNGSFTQRSQLLEVKGIGAKTYTQCAGFLRIPDSKEPLDNTNIHPESYPKVAELLKKLKFKTKDIINASHKQKLDVALDGLNLETTSADLELGLPTLVDIIADLKKPGRDPRASAPIVQLDNQISSFDQLKPGMTLTGRVVNVTSWGAFVDVGIEHSGLVLPKDIIDPSTNLPVPKFYRAVSTGLVGQFEVTDIDHARQRYNLRIVLEANSKTV